MDRDISDFKHSAVFSRSTLGSFNFIVAAAGSGSENLTTQTASVVAHTVQRNDGFMAGGRSGTIDQTSVLPPAAASTAQPIAQPHSPEPSAANQAKQDAHAAHERHLCQIGADLHDGPAQLLALALLHIGALELSQSDAAMSTAPIRDTITEALREVRDISVGLVLPELERRTARATAHLAVENYQRRTGCLVTVDDADLPADFNPSKAIKICLYRLIQEGLQNGFKHARGADQTVALCFTPASENSDAILVAKVRDVRPGLCIVSHNTDDHSTWRRADGTSTGIGLAGLKERITALNGTFEINATPSSTELVARIAVVNTSNR
jgi:signal transduction histidine kinase